MDGEANNGLPTALEGYARAAVETFFEKAAAARARLESVIAAAQTRREHAIAAQVRNRAIAQDAQREITEIRSDAEERASQIIAAARTEADQLLRSAREHAGVTDTDAIDLGARALEEAHDLPVPPLLVSVNGERADDELTFAALARSARADVVNGDAGSADYFDFLRGAQSGDASRAE